MIQLDVFQILPKCPSSPMQHQTLVVFILEIKSILRWYSTVIRRKFRTHDCGLLPGKETGNSGAVKYISMGRVLNVNRNGPIYIGFISHRSGEF